MKIETQEIQFDLKMAATVAMSQLQKDYFQILKQEKTIAKTVFFYYQQGWLVQFSELYGLIYNLTQVKSILNFDFYHYFQSLILKTNPEKAFVGQESATTAIQAQQIRSLPFFRNLKEDSYKMMMSQAKVVGFPHSKMIIQEKSLDRDMYVLLSGSVGIYKRGLNQDRFRVATLVPGCLFGEYGFFLNEPRLADVCTLTDSQILKITYLPNIFDSWIKKEVAESLKHRFWVIHGIMKSPILSILPEDTTDQLIHRGKIVEIPAQQFIFKERTPGQFFYVVIQGSVVINQNGININVLNAGDCFGELSLFVNQGIRTASAITQAPTLLLEIHSRDFYQLMAENLFLAKEIERLAYSRLKNDQKRLKSGN